MAAIFEPVTIGWDGKEYTIKMTFERACQLDDEVPIAVMAHRAAIGEIRITQVAKAVSILLGFAGVEATGEEVYAHLLHAGEQEVMGIVAAVVTALFATKQGEKQGNDKAPKKSRKSGK